MQKASRTVLVKSSHLLEKTSSLIASTRSSAHQFSKRFYATSCISSPNKPCYPGAVNATFTHQLEFRSSINPDGTPFPIFNIMSNDGEIVNEEAFKEIDVSSLVVFLELLSS
nr:unnamed protein product [Naegleria fowleri]